MVKIWPGLAGSASARDPCPCGSFSYDAFSYFNDEFSSNPDGER